MLFKTGTGSESSRCLSPFLKELCDTRLENILKKLIKHGCLVFVETSLQEMLDLSDADMAWIELSSDLGGSICQRVELSSLPHVNIAHAAGLPVKELRRVLKNDPKVTLDTLFKLHFSLGGTLKELVRTRKRPKDQRLLDPSELLHSFNTPTGTPSHAEHDQQAERRR
jgi:hypothetical protein